MAKISARGDKAVAKWRKPNGGLVTLTAHGRVLAQAIAGDTYHLVATFKGRDDGTGTQLRARCAVVEKRYGLAGRMV